MQDCGLVVNPKTAESQVFGACIMSVCAALVEERVMDPQTGRVLNADMEFYKLAGISDIGDIVVHMDIVPENDKRGIIGLGEPPADRRRRGNRERRRKRSGRARAACSVDTQERTGRIAWPGEERLMQNFEYASPSTVKEATALLGASWADAQVLAGRHRPDQPDEGLRRNSAARREHQEHQGTRRHFCKQGWRVASARVVTFEELMNRTRRSGTSSHRLVAAVRGVTSPQIRNMGTVGGDLCQRPRCWYFRTGNGLLAMKDGKSLVPNGENRYHAIFGSGPAYFVSASSLGPALIALGAKVKLTSATGNREVALDKFFVVAAERNDARDRAGAERNPDRDRHPGFGHEECHLRSPGEGRSRLAAGDGVGCSEDERQHAWSRHGWCSATWPPRRGSRPRRRKMLAGKTITEDVAEQVGQAAVAGAKPLSDNAYKVQLAKVAVKRALLEAGGGKAV